MILRDPVHGLLAFEGLDDRVVSALLGTREVQRLRRIRQLGLTSLVFPGAEHSRFAHAVGAAHVMTLLCDQLEAKGERLPIELRMDAGARMDAVAAALLHDLGHGPFSHLFEQAIPNARHHESWTYEIIEDSGTQVHRALEELSTGMATRVANMLRGQATRPYLSRAVSGRWDVDRADYLLRDSHMTGVSYGLYDLEWLLRSFAFAEHESGQWVIAIEGRKGLPPIEGFFLARNHMYGQVYHHKATRAAEGLIRAIFVRLAERVRGGDAPKQTPAALKAMVLDETCSLGDFLALDDATVQSAIATWAQDDDDVLASRCDALLTRRLPKTMPLPKDSPLFWSTAEARAREVVENMGLRGDLSVHLDLARDVPFAEKDAHEDDGTGLYVSIRHRPLQRLGDVSFLLRQLRGKEIIRPRLVFPAEAREAVLGAIGDLESATLE